LLTDLGQAIGIFCGSLVLSEQAEPFADATSPDGCKPFVLGYKPIICSPMHPFGPFGKRLVERARATKALPDFLSAARTAEPGWLILRFVSEPVTAAAAEVSATIEDTATSMA
jgi:hypothetical protein